MFRWLVVVWLGVSVDGGCLIWVFRWWLSFGCRWLLAVLGLVVLV